MKSKVATEVKETSDFYYIANTRVLYKVDKDHMYLNPAAFVNKGEVIIDNMIECGDEIYMQRSGCTTDDGKKLKVLIYSSHSTSIALDAEIFNTFGVNTEVFFNVDTKIARIEKVDTRTDTVKTVGYMKPEFVKEVE